MVGSFLMAVVCVMTSQYVLYYMQRLPTTAQKTAFTARAAWLVEASTVCFRCSSILYISGLSLMGRNYHSTSRFVDVPAIVGLCTAGILSLCFLFISNAYAKASMKATHAILEDIKDDDDHVDRMRQALALYNGKVVVPFEYFYRRELEGSVL